MKRGKEEKKERRERRWVGDSVEKCSCQPPFAMATIPRWVVCLGKGLAVVASSGVPLLAN